ncbi:MAG: peptidoglycan bridge formation glycyltransferase FemA/FemB family protein [Sulfuricurvum sp.]|nr:peptidoglycan bridge formation glycyltransferase FemA/FemB family protein [Sulfuricurvum sp.]
MGESDAKDLNLLLTTDFVTRWRECYQHFYGYRQEGEFLAVPSLSGGETLCYVPGLTYSDVSRENAGQLIDEAKGKPFNIRTLDGTKTSFEPYEPVTMRLWIGDQSYEDVFSRFHSTKRRNLRRAQECGAVSKIGNSAELVDDFYHLYTMTMHRLGTPPLSKKLFLTLREYIEVEIAVAYIHDEPAAALLIVYDDRIAWNPYAASDRKFADTFANEAVYRDAIYRAIDKGKDIFDCGRSPYGGGTYQFKKKMGARAVGLGILRHKEENIYAKYSVAAKLWQKLPKSVADVIGPKLRRYLADS